VLTPEAYEHLERLGLRMAAGCHRLVGPGAQTVALGSKGCVHRPDPNPERSELIWLWLANRGIFTTAGRDQEWNVTVAHDEASVERYVEVFGELAARLRD
jgi:glutamate-1-semialdehyde 2,1-aminomutase